MSYSIEYLETIASTLDNNELLRLHQEMALEESYARNYRERIELILRQRMEADGATSIAHETLEVQLVYPSPKYDYAKLRGLAELVPPHMLTEAFYPEHEEILIVPDNWDARVFKSWAKYGDAVRNVIAAAMIPGTPSLKIAPKKEKADG